MKTIRSRCFGGKGQQGINMVDLMMWLVIAALLLAAAIQGIGYYQQASYLHQMENDALHAAEAVTAKTSQVNGAFTADIVAQGTSDSAKTKDVSVNPDAGASDAAGYVLRATHPAVTDKDVVFLSKQRGAYSPGIHVIPKGTVIDPDGGTTVAAPTSPSSGGGSTTSTTADPTNIMTTVWDTSIAGCSNIVLPLSGNVNTVVNWGDGSAAEPFNYFYDVQNVYSYNLPNHTYTGNLGPTTITLTGTFDNWVGPNWDTWSSNCITNVQSWGDGTNTKDAEAGFYGTTALTQVARIPSTLTNISSLFGSSSFNGDLSNWDTSHVTDMSFVFSDGSSFNGDISKWNTASVTNLRGMFQNNTLFNGDISNWNTGNVTNLQGVFQSNTAFNGDLSKWNTANVTNLQSTFQDSVFNGNISNWKTGNVTSALSTFRGTSFNGDVSNWDMSNATDISAMFMGTPFNGDLSRWNTSKVKNMMSTFQDSGFNNNSISGWNLSSADSIQFMFSGASKFNGDISNWNTSRVTDMSGLFYGNTVFNGDITKWDTSNVNSMGSMFSGASSFNQNIGNWNVSTAFNMQNMFQDNPIFNQDLTRWAPPVGVNHTDFNTNSALTSGNLPTFR